MNEEELLSCITVKEFKEILNEFASKIIQGSRRTDIFPMYTQPQEYNPSRLPWDDVNRVWCSENNGEIKCIIGSAVWDVKTIKTTKSIIKIKTVAGMILNDTIKTGDDDEYIQYLEKWYNGIEKDNEKARRIVICSLLHGILTLLSLKHNINFLDDKKNSERADVIKFEFSKILEYCGIDKEYLL